MLISMPTGTSTILGVFQAILALLVKWDELVLPGKLLRKEKFASEIFAHFPCVFMLHRKRNSQFCAARCQTKAASTGSEWPRALLPLTFGPGYPRRTPDKKL
jgi:hypothetical protein